MKQIICPKCKTDNPEEANFCRHCGHQFKEFSISNFDKRNRELYAENQTIRREYDELRREVHHLENELYHYERREWRIEGESRKVKFYGKLCVIFFIAFLLTLSAGVFGLIHVKKADKKEYTEQTILSNYVLTKRQKVSDYDMGEFIFSGTLKDGLPNGFGEATYKDGRKFTGTFVNGKRHGEKCVFTFSNGDVFEGEFSEDNIFKGVFTSHQKESFNYTFTGDFHNNAPYSGTWRDDNGAVFQTLLNGSAVELER